MSSQPTVVAPETNEKGEGADSRRGSAKEKRKSTSSRGPRKGSSSSSHSVEGPSSIKLSAAKGSSSKVRRKSHMRLRTEMGGKVEKKLIDGISESRQYLTIYCVPS